MCRKNVWASVVNENGNASVNYTEADIENLNNSFDIVQSTYKDEFDLAAGIVVE